MISAKTTTEPTDRAPVPSASGRLGLRQIPKGRRLTGQDAITFATYVIKAYRTKSIRSISAETGRSYGAIHRILTISGVTMRPRGRTQADAS
ncbi:MULTISPECIES: helix-turn-helix domain-containing protein [Streptomyces]|uniref:Helix-turn-helix domain-containing protein n=1 Tax=Streptomyces canarius TaxID=285453 RepID=A0ABQ3D171_9ACTN|nr:helix-turn-helix domain-containing protein [Streptomyces canarius]GHA51770.1 hypothetical protein GCM10010345_65450 [Streptomyces canarius]